MSMDWYHRIVNNIYHHIFLQFKNLFLLILYDQYVSNHLVMVEIEIVTFYLLFIHAFRRFKDRCIIMEEGVVLCFEVCPRIVLLIFICFFKVNFVIYYLIIFKIIYFVFFSIFHKFIYYLC